MVDQHAEITRVLALMGLAEAWHLEPDPNGIPDMVILRGRKVSLPVSLPDLGDNPDDEDKDNANPNRNRESHCLGSRKTDQSKPGSSP